MPVIDAKRTGEKIGVLRDALPTLDNMLILANLFGVKIDDIIVVKVL